MDNCLMNFKRRKGFVLLYIIFYFLLFSGFQNKPLPYEDITHYSQVFSKEKTYRLYLPDGYKQSKKKYPVIYFFHGWGGRYYKDDSAKLEYEMIGELVNKYQFILVMWDGNMDESEPRPYNIGDHHDVKFDIQMKDYFIEFITHIDSTYRTLTDRSNRGIIGFSMGGIMSYYLAGKYPDKVSAAVNMVGSPDFFMGLPGNHSHYQVKYTFDNLRDVGLLFHNRDECPMSGLNDEVNNGAIWSGSNNYEYLKLAGEHKVDNQGEIKVFESTVRFVIDQFNNPRPMNDSWSHYDFCPEFELWGYSVKSNKNEPGFLFLRNVSSNGFGFYTKKWLPDGPAIKECKTIVSTAPIYDPGVNYQIRVFNQLEKQFSTLNIAAGPDGRLVMELNGDGYEIGIEKKEQQISFATIGYQLRQNNKFLRVNEENELAVDIFNRGDSYVAEGNLRVTLSCADSSVTISLPTQEIYLQSVNQVFKTKPFKIFSNKIPPADGSPKWLLMKVQMDCDTFHFEDEFLLPVWYDLSRFNNIQIDDGCMVAATANQSDYNHTLADSIYGKGNGDGVASPGEQIMLYKNGHRLRLYTEDPFVITSDEILVDEMLPAVWPDGFTLSSVVKIAENCPEGHEIEFQAHYETKTHGPIYRHLKWGKVKIKIRHN